MTENSDAALLNCVETRGQREQRALSRAIEAKENGECGWRNREGHVDSRACRAPTPDAEILPAERPRRPFCRRSEELAGEAEDSSPSGSVPDPCMRPGGNG